MTRFLLVASGGALGAMARYALGLTVGRLAPGYRADILLLADNPLLTIENSRRIVAVIANGALVEGVVSATP